MRKALWHFVMSLAYVLICPFVPWTQVLAFFQSEQGSSTASKFMVNQGQWVPHIALTVGIQSLQLSCSNAAMSPLIPQTS